MTDRNLRRSAVIGLVVTTVLVVLTMSIGGLHIFERTYSVRADFDSASGIAAGDPVRVAGVEVGSVSKVERLARDKAVRLTLKVDKSTWLGQGTRAAIRLRTLLGSRYVALDTPSTGRRLPADTLIPRDRTQTPVELDETLDALNRVAQPFDVDSFNRLVAAFAAGLEGHAPQLNSMLHDLATLSGTLAERREDIDRLVAATEKLGTAIDFRRDSLGTGIDNFAAILSTLAGRRAELTGLVSAVRGLSDRLTPLLDRNQGTIGQALTDLVTTVGVLDRQKDRLDLALGNLPEFARRLIKVTDDGSFINVYYVGTIPGPYLADPADLGEGGLPTLWVDPPASAPDANAGGTEIDGDDESPEPPSGYPQR